MRTIGSQTRELLEETAYQLVKTWPDVDRGMIVLEDETGKRELWARNDHCAGYVVQIGKARFEFVRSLPREE